jgi:secreted trypsin-like serine protease
MRVLILFAVAIAAVCCAETDDERRIVNGQDADIADFPHALSLLDLGRYICGASVISRYFALSAGE